MRLLTRPWAPLLLAAGAVAGAALRSHAQNGGDVGFPYGDLKEVTLQGRMVHLGDTLARKYGARPAADGPKQWALALPEGQLYTFLDTDAYRRLVAGREPGQPVEVKARHFPRSQLLEVREFRTLPAEAVRRRFFCPVCVITTEDWGPCVCCGKEMEPQK